MVAPNLDDLVSDDLFESKYFFFFYPSLSYSSSLPPLPLDELESEPLRFELLLIGVFDAGKEDMFGLSLFFEVLLDELPELEALSLLEVSAFWIIFPCVELI